MFNKTLKPAFQIIFVTFLLMVIINTGCNSSTTNENTATDTSVNPSAVPDTTHMDTATTRPVKNTN